RPGRAAGHGRGGRAAHRDRLLLPGPGLPHPPGDPEPGLLPAAGSLPVHRHRRADRQLHHRRRLRPGRPAGPRPDAGRGQMTAAQPLPDPTTAPEEPAAAAPEAPRREALYFALRNPKLIVGLTIVLLFLLVGLVVPPFLEHGPGDRYAPPLLPPSGEHWFGTTQFGQDLFTQFAYGVRATFLVGLLGGGIAAVIGMTIGFVADYKGGWIDEVLNMLTNVVLVLPTMAVLFIIAAYVDSYSVATQSFFIGMTSWPWAARAVRSQALSLSSRDFVDLARLSGVRPWKIIVRDIAPNMGSYLFMTFILLFGGAVLA